MSGITEITFINKYSTATRKNFRLAFFESLHTLVSTKSSDPEIPLPYGRGIVFYNINKCFNRFLSSKKSDCATYHIFLSILRVSNSLS